MSIKQLKNSFKKQDEKDPKAIIIIREQTKKTVVEILGKEDTKTI
jgi:septum site-determining protein MinD